MTEPVLDTSDAQGAVAAVNSIDHVAIAVYDADAAAAWFCRQLGLVNVNDELIHSDVNVRLVFLAVGSGIEKTSIQLVSPIGPGTVAEHLSDHGEGLHHVCFKVDDVRRVLDRLGEPNTPTFAGGYGLTCAFMQQSTPCDTNIELVGEGDAGPDHGAERAAGDRDGL